MSIEQHFRENGDRARVLKEPINGAWVVYDHRKASNLAYRILRNWEDAEDCVQETYERVIRYFNSFDNSRDFNAWFDRILVRVCLKHRDGTLSAPDTVEADDTLSFEEYLSEADKPEHYVELVEWTEKISKLKERVSPRDYEILSLFFVYGHLREDISNMLCVHVKTVDRVLGKYRKSLGL